MLAAIRLRQIIIFLLVMFWAILLITIFKDAPAASFEPNLTPTNLEAPVTPIPKNPSHVGIASWYSYRISDYDSADHYVCASRDFPRRTWLKVTAGNEVTHCLVTDYGPEAWTGRIIDLSPKAFAELAPLSLGLVEVEVSEN